MRFLSFAILFSLLSACQSSPKRYSKYGRNIASTSSLRVFVQEMASRSKNITAKELEERMLSYLKTRQKNLEAGNWKYMGLTDEQAKNVKSIYDDMPYMQKVRKWMKTNITKVVKVEGKIAREAYDAMLASRQIQSTNPYKFHQKSGSMVNSRRNSLGSIASSLDDNRKLVLHNIKDLTSDDKGISTFIKKELRKYQRTYKKNYLALRTRAKNNPLIAANVNESIDNAVTITKLTGKKGMGEGCETFNKYADETILATKTDIDNLRAQIISTKASEKAKKPFSHFSELSDDLRLTQKEIDDATVEAFKRVNGLTDDEARVVVKRLKSKPCRLY